MYSKDDGYIYFTDIEEAKALYREDENGLWGTRLMAHDKAWFELTNKPQFNCEPEYYRRCLTPDFRIRKEFCDDDPVCWAGANGVIKPCHHPANGYHVFAEFKNDIGIGFTADGKFKTWHKNPSLSHGHDSTVDNQKYPVERIKTKKDQKAMPQADEVSECIPHWQENLRLAIEGEKINVAWEACCLCVKYFGKAKGYCHQCPIYKDTNEICCSATPYKKAISGNPKHVLEMLNYLIDLERRLRKAGK